MKKALLTTALIAAMGTAASAQGITPVAPVATTGLTVGALTVAPGVIALGVVAVGVAVAVGQSSDGTN